MRDKGQGARLKSPPAFSQQVDGPGPVLSCPGVACWVISVGGGGVCVCVCGGVGGGGCWAISVGVGRVGGNAIIRVVVADNVYRERRDQGTSYVVVASVGWDVSL